MSGREAAGDFIRRCCQDLGDDPKRVKLMYLVTYWCVQRPDGRWRLVLRKPVEDQERESVRQALNHVGADSHLDCRLPVT